MAGVKGQWELTLNLGGYEYPTPSPESVPELNWFETIHQSLPTLNLTVKDYTGDVLRAVGGGDGTIIDITLGDGSGKATSAKFNIQGSPNVSPGRGYYNVKLNAVLDVVKYTRSVPTGLYEGTSASVISRLASEAGLRAKVIGSVDSQVWLPSGKTMHEWVRQIANHGYANASSLMMLGVTDQKELVYGDANQLINMGGVVFTPPGGGGIPINDWTATSNGMIGNNIKGYGATSIEFDPTGVVKELNKISSVLFGKTGFFASANNIASVGGLGGRIDIRPMSGGNTHEKYTEARHQNTRNRSLFSADLNILTHTVSGVQLLSGCEVQPPNLAYSNSGGSSIAEEFAGRYLITGKTKSLMSSKYCERVTCTTNGN